MQDADYKRQVALFRAALRPAYIVWHGETRLSHDDEATQIERGLRAAHVDAVPCDDAAVERAAKALEDEVKARCEWCGLDNWSFSEVAEFVFRAAGGGVMRVPNKDLAPRPKPSTGRDTTAPGGWRGPGLSWMSCRRSGERRPAAAGIRSIRRSRRLRAMYHAARQT